MIGEGFAMSCRSFTATSPGPSTFTAAMMHQTSPAMAVQRSKEAVGPDFLFTDDSARLHLGDEFLENEVINRLDWQARSPELNTVNQGSATL
ncbi:hypothetical protein TNCV_4450051 [Trichonephila clavipes]|nr:hypothetical protein TNCV_4450051 [Trichonephila clavipes]